MASILSFFQGNGLVAILAAFTTASVLLNALASVLQAWGKTAPSWIGTVLSGIGSIVHFLNGNVAAAAPVAPASVAK